jgi:3'-phosphoadenosine 5'-phosphosulfate sulfotransferase (PAPS reductase)/FAD synthetase
MVVSWFSAGVSSAVATKLAIKKYINVKIIYTHIDDQHPDSMRFLKDCEKWFNQKIEILQSRLKTVNDACLKSSFIKSAFGASCTRLLKRRVRKEWEYKNPGKHVYVWGMDFNETKREERIKLSMPNYNHYFPLIERKLTKKEAHGIIEKEGIKRPEMYNLGYPNNNCIGCLKGGMGYWNKIKIDFPEVFKKRCELEEKINGRIFKDFLLKDLPKNRGREQKIIIPECGIFCEMERRYYDPIPR